MNEKKIKSIAIIGLIFGLLALSQSSAITNFSINLIAGTGINISQSGDNYTISATGTGSNGSDNTKINKSSDTITGKIKFDFLDGNISDELPQNRFIEYYHNNSIRTYLNRFGSQLWYLNSSGVSKGLIAYVTPGDFPGIAFLNGTFATNSRRDLRGTPSGLEIVIYSNGTQYKTTFNTIGGLKIEQLAGTGNRPICADPNGNFVIC